MTVDITSSTMSFQQILYLIIATNFQLHYLLDMMYQIPPVKTIDVKQTKQHCNLTFECIYKFISKYIINNTYNGKCAHFV